MKNKPSLLRYWRMHCFKCAWTRVCVHCVRKRKNWTTVWKFRCTDLEEVRKKRWQTKRVEWMREWERIQNGWTKLKRKICACVCVRLFECCVVQCVYTNTHLMRTHVKFLVNLHNKRVRGTRKKERYPTNTFRIRCVQWNEPINQKEEEKHLKREREREKEEEGRYVWTLTDKTKIISDYRGNVLFSLNFRLIFIFLFFFRVEIGRINGWYAVIYPKLVQMDFIRQVLSIIKRSG